MDRINLMCRRCRFVFVSILLLLGHSATATALGKPCWAEFYEYAQYLGAQVRLQGPLSLANLKDVDGKNWDSRIDSLKVGPKAKVTIFEHPNFKLTLTEMAKHPVLMESLGITEEDIRLESELIFGPDEKSHHLGEFNFHQKTRSIKIECV